MTDTDQAPTERGRAKASRRSTLLAEAARLFALHGYNGVSIEDLGAASGISGPAVYRHFPGKSAVLGALLTGVSADLLDGGRSVAGAGGGAAEVLARLVDFHAEFALGHRDVIRVQDRDLASLSDGDAAEVRRLQRAYIDVWADELLRLHPREDRAAARFRAQAVFGLLNSTPHSTHRTDSDPDARRLRLTAMARAALSAPVP
ncbi:TetR/AcrR family transcriptional regulator [Zafaria sp. Z1313]|uniref:TetR/AcrR family transcriptional regulator n=1 Tax=unclassified Zafaria TaxID=2828765 RepID=UPI002E7893AF|nr:TetR/AcrR family transcriptional regulator [Zafaria sp. J156]MEE1620084.1 TetR/AcrR family transcriptional regulator [Zafaria sp. J156]